MKPNLNKPFTEEAWKAGKRFCNEHGDEVTDIKKFEGIKEGYPDIFGVIGGCLKELNSTWPLIFEAEETVTVWYNVYRRIDGYLKIGETHPNEVEARKELDLLDEFFYIGTQSITYTI